MIFSLTVFLLKVNICFFMVGVMCCFTSSLPLELHIIPIFIWPFFLSVCCQIDDEQLNISHVHHKNTCYMKVKAIWGTYLREEVLEDQENLDESLQSKKNKLQRGGIRNVIWSFSPLGSCFDLEASFVVTERCCHVVASFCSWCSHACCQWTGVSLKMASSWEPCLREQGLSGTTTWGQCLPNCRL